MKWKEGEISEIVTAACSSLTIGTALVRLWRKFGNDSPGFEAAATKADVSIQEFKSAKTDAIAAINAADSERLIALLSEWPLAVLSVLDEQRHLECNGDDGSVAALVKIDHESYWLYRRCLSSTSKASRTEKRSGHMQHWLTHHWVLPVQHKGIEVTIASAPKRIRDSCRSLLKKKRVRIWVGDFPDNICPDWLAEYNGKRALRLKDDTGTRHAGLLAMLDAAKAAEADLIVLPELSLPPDLQTMVGKWLLEHSHPFSLILPGTFHVEEEQGVFNRARLFDGIGRTVLEHRKLRPFRVDNDFEQIDSGCRLDLLDTPVGLFAIPICLDYCERESPYLELWQYLGLEWALVPAFGVDTSVRAHLQRAKDMAGFFATVTVLANQHPEGIELDQGFVCHPEQQKEKKLQITDISTDKRCVEVCLQSVDSDN